MESSSLVHGAYYWLRLLETNDLYVGQAYYAGTFTSFQFCGDDGVYDPQDFEVLEMIEYKGNK